jgi:vacuolar-type H+-ATPase subunit I/STV1
LQPAKTVSGATNNENMMAVFEGWTLAAARGAARKSLIEIAEASKVGPRIIDDLEHARDINPTDGRFDMAEFERVIDVYRLLGYRIVPRTWFTSACVKRVQ